ncbi:MAG: histidine kinase [Bacteroidota bacterium]
MTIFYYITIAVDSGIYPSIWAVTSNFALKGLISLPVWWLFFNKLSSLSILQKLLIHLITLPIFIVLWIYIYYAICDSFGFFRLRGQRTVWDVYLTALFYIIQFGSFHLYVYYNRLQQQQLIAAQLGKLNLQSELSALKAQLNPHFLYNVFNTINSAIPKTAKSARDMVNKLSDLFRYQLKASREELVTVEEELAFVKKYLELEKERFGERLMFRFEVADDLLDCKIPPILFQPIIENSIKHGISSLIEGGEIILSIEKEEDRLQMTIRDSGVGIAQQNKEGLLTKGVGLSNTNERLKKMYGEELEIMNYSPSGTIVKFSIPSCL